MSVEPIVTTYEEGTLLVLQNWSATEVVRIGIETLWGGSVVEVSVNGRNIVNRHDTGREVQVAVYDHNPLPGCPQCTDADGWNPVQGGDIYGHGSPVLVQRLDPRALYVKTRPYHWNADNNGGGPNQPVLSDMLFEQTITPVPGKPRAFKLEYVLTHLGEDDHASTTQELPAVYVNREFDRCAEYSGMAPWTGAPITFSDLSPPNSQLPLLVSAENWNALVDSQNFGLAVFTPGQYPYSACRSFPGGGGPLGNGTNYMVGVSTFGISPRAVLTAEYYVVAADVGVARQTIDRLRLLPSPNKVAAPLGELDTPISRSVVAGTVNVAGWSFANGSQVSVEVLVDGQHVGQATLGDPRPDVLAAWPLAGANCGYQFSLDSRGFSNGAHTLSVRSVDGAGNSPLVRTIDLTFAN